uniref:Ferritin n=1 Tax=Hadrurus spadix TaxID=141984 RepID=A0A1W7R9J5_9SCOR
MLTATFLAFLSTLAMARVDNELKQPHKDRYVLHNQCLVGLQRQIDEEMHASLTYMSMAAHFGNNDIARQGFSKFFSENSKEEKEHAEKIIDYINKRGGKVSSFDIKMPTKDTWQNGLEALEDALNLEKRVNNKLYHLHDLAEKVCLDPHLMDFVEEEYLNEQVESIDKLSRYISMLRAMDSGMGEYLIDQELLGKKVEL